MSKQVYRVATDEGLFYDITADAVYTDEFWLKFGRYNLARSEHEIVAVIDGSCVNNVQLVNPETGIADKIIQYEGK